MSEDTTPQETAKRKAAKRPKAITKVERALPGGDGIARTEPLDLVALFGDETKTPPRKREIEAIADGLDADQLPPHQSAAYHLETADDDGFSDATVLQGVFQQIGSTGGDKGRVLRVNVAVAKRFVRLVCRKKGTADATAAKMTLRLAGTK